MGGETFPATTRTAFSRKKHTLRSSVLIVASELNKSTGANRNIATSEVAHSFFDHVLNGLDQCARITISKRLQTFAKLRLHLSNQLRQKTIVGASTDNLLQRVTGVRNFHGSDQTLRTHQSVLNLAQNIEQTFRKGLDRTQQRIQDVW